MRLFMILFCVFLMACSPKSEAEEEVNLDRLVQVEESADSVR